MTAEITAEQAPQIHDLESYKTVTGAKRFKRTAEEMKLGLSPEDALKRRLAAFDPNWLANNPAAKAAVDRGLEQAKAGQFTDGPSQFRTKIEATFVPDRSVLVKPGDIVIRIRAGKNVPNDYFEHLPNGEIVVVEDDKFYGWLDVFFSGRYNGTPAEFFTEALDQGLGELISHPTTEPAAEPQENMAGGHNVEDSTTVTAEG